MAKLVKAEWVIKVNDELKPNGDSSSKEREQYREKLSIYRLPAFVTDLNNKAYQPEAVSFGPYHHGRKHLRPMEKSKRQALFKFLKRSSKRLEDYIESLAPVVQDLKDSYDSLDCVWQQDTDAFLELMILDGCFMLEILRKSASIDESLETRKSSTEVPITLSSEGDDYASSDPVFSNHGKLYFMPYIKRDMLMIENQLPMMLLHNLLAVQNDKEKLEEKFIYNLIHKFYFSTDAPDLGMGKCLHVLDLYRKSLLSGKRTPPAVDTTSHGGNDEIIRSATKLHEARIKFSQSVTRSLKDISFDHGVLKLPRVVVDDTTESTFLNLIALERFHVGAGNEVTSYVYFMDCIIDDAEDVAHLKSQGIILNAIGSDKAVAKLFNSLAKDITIEPNSSLDMVHKNVNNYCRNPWNKCRSSLVQTYFRNRWAILSVAAAIFLFAFTIIQTTYTVLSYHHSG